MNIKESNDAVFAVCVVIGLLLAIFGVYWELKIFWRDMMYVLN